MKLPVACLVAGVMLTSFQRRPDPLWEGFRNPPASAKPHVYYMMLNGHLDREQMEREIAEFAAAGIGGLCVFDIGARGDLRAQSPAGPAFLSPAWVRQFQWILEAAGRHGLEVDLSVSSSWDMGAGWVRPDDASMSLAERSLTLEGGRRVDVQFKGFAGVEVATLAIPIKESVAGHEFVFELKKPRPHRIDRVLLFNNDKVAAGERTHFAKDFEVAISNSGVQSSAFETVVSETLEARGGGQEFRFPAKEARYVRLRVKNGYAGERVELAEFEVYGANGEHVNPNYRVNRYVDPAGLLRSPSARGIIGEWSAEKIHDGIREGARGSWASGESPSLLLRDVKDVIDLSGQKEWLAPAGKWLLVQYRSVPTGEKLKVPSPNSDGLATDHLRADVTRRYMDELLGRLSPALNERTRPVLKDLYLASYEVRGLPWTGEFLAEFQKRRGYDLKPYLPVLRGSQIGGEDTSERVLFDFRKTQGELLVDAYYRAAVEASHRAGFTVESEAGGPGPHLHQVPVDSLLAQGSVDSVRGEFWPDRMSYDTIWVVKETASAARIYGKKRVHMEAFTTNNHWEEGPQDLKLAGDRAFAEGMNHVVWHTAAHMPRSGGKPGSVYYAGTHLNTNVPWWPMAKGFLGYLTRTSYLLQQGEPVADVLYYYGDQGYNFVPPKHAPEGLGAGYGYDVTNADALRRRLRVRGDKLQWPEGGSYELLVLPKREDIEVGVLAKVEELLRAGAKVLGQRPKRASGWDPEGKRDATVRETAARLWDACESNPNRQTRVGRGLLYCGPSEREILQNAGLSADFVYGGSGTVDFNHRRAGDVEIYFVHNQTDRAIEGEARFRIRGKRAELWDAVEGERGAARIVNGEAGRIQIALAAHGSIFVVFRSGRGITTLLPSSALSEKIAVTGDWRVQFDGLAAPSEESIPVLRSWTNSAREAEKYFSGMARYEAVVNIPKAWIEERRLVYVDLGDLWAVGSVELNGVEQGIAWSKPFRVRLREGLRAGENRLEVRVANNWMNRLIGDARLPEERRSTKTNVTTTRTSPAKTWRELEPRASGLFGPVTLLAGPNGSAAINNKD
jgi:hypothetical protein